VEDDREPLVLDRPVHARRELAQRLAPALGLGSELEPVNADILGSLDTDEPCSVLPSTPADAGDERIKADQPPYLRACLLWNGGQLRARHDRRQRPVHVEQDRRLGRPFGERGDEIAGGHAHTI
jgi:hypothetical protein